VSTFIKDKLKDNVQSVMRNALEGVETSNYELEFETKGKGTRYLLVNATTRRDPDGKTVGVVGVAQDVTDTKDKEKAVTAVAQELRQLVDTANAPIFGIDVNGYVVSPSLLDPPQPTNLLTLRRTSGTTRRPRSRAFHARRLSTSLWCPPSSRRSCATTCSPSCATLWRATRRRTTSWSSRPRTRALGTCCRLLSRTSKRKKS
jgi:hypothetical protein